MKITEKFYIDLASFFAAIEELTAKFEPVYKRVERFAGSEGYSDAKTEIDQQRAAEVERVRQQYRPMFDAVFASMTDAVQARKMTPPTSEELSILQVLRMKKSVTKDEIKQAANTITSPAALGVLEEIAADAEVYGVEYPDVGEMTTTEALHVIDCLRRSVDTLLYRFDGLTSTSQYINDGEYGLFHLTSRKPTDAADAVRKFGYCSNFALFSKAVDA